MSTKFSPTPSELVFVNQIFAQADFRKLGILTGDVAVKVFGGAKLPSPVLGEIWNIADEDNNGWLPRKGVAIAVRLIGWAQNGEKVSEELVHKPGPLPIIEGITAVVPQSSGISLPKFTSPVFPSLTSQERSKFVDIFIKAGPDQDGLLSSTKARDVFLKSKLSNEKLLQVWNLADTQGRGFLDVTDFAIGMYFIQGLLSSSITFIPNTLPSGLYQEAAGQVFSHAANAKSLVTDVSKSSQFNSSSSTISVNQSTIQPLNTGQSHLLQPDYSGVSADTSRQISRPLRSASTGFGISSFFPVISGIQTHWDISPQDKAASDVLFDDLDSQSRGFIEGEVAVPFMLKSNLPSEDLARVWDSADLNGDGKLTREGFAVAMHLIQKKLTGLDIFSIFPPLSVPSMHTSVASPHSPTSQHRQNTPKDLFLDEIPPNSVPPQEVNYDYLAEVPALTPHHDLLGDEEHSYKSQHLHDHSEEIGNITNQLISTTRSAKFIKGKRISHEQTLENQASQLSALQAQLTSVRAACEIENELISTLKKRNSAQIADIQKLNEELIRAESDLSAIREEKVEIQGAFMKDKECVRELRRKLSSASQEMKKIKMETEKLRKEARQEKGHLVISRKQLSSKDAEAAKAIKEFEDALAVHASVMNDGDEARYESVTLFNQSNDKTNLTRSFTKSSSRPLSTSTEPSSLSNSFLLAQANDPFDLVLGTVPAFDSPSLFLPCAQSSAKGSCVQPDSFNLVGAAKVESDSPIDESSNKSNKAKSSPASYQIISTSVPDSPFFNVMVDGSGNCVSSPTPPGPDHSETSSPIPSTTFPTTVTPASDDLASNLRDGQVEMNGADTVCHPESHETKVETDFSMTLMELQRDESVSNCENEVPLAHLTDHGNDGNLVAMGSIQSTSPRRSKPLTAFEDTFGSASSTDNVNGDTDEMSVNPAAATTAAKVGVTVSGSSAFDEAMGSIPRRRSNVPEALAFDPSFEDNFDFESAARSSIFNSPSGSKDPAEEPSVQPRERGLVMIRTTADETQETTFLNTEDRMMASGNVELLSHDPGVFVAVSDFGGNVSNQTALPSTSDTPSGPTSSPSILAPNSPTTRSKSPPFRMASPKTRPSTSSSSKEQEKPKEIPPRNSKLSQIRLPFGRKKKQQQQHRESVPPISLPPLLSDTLGNENDETIQKLMAMGFSRHNATIALERNGYNLQSALESLLGE